MNVTDFVSGPRVSSHGFVAVLVNVTLTSKRELNHLITAIPSGLPFPAVPRPLLGRATAYMALSCFPFWVGKVMAGTCFLLGSADVVIVDLCWQTFNAKGY